MHSDADIRRLLPILERARRVVLTTHVHPDGDGIGSEIALGRMLARRGASVAIINHSPTPQVYRWLDPREEIRRYDDARDRGDLLAADVILILDTNHPERLRSMQGPVLESQAVRVCIDHHLDPHPFAPVTLIDDDATSTGELIYQVLLHLHGPDLPQDVASALYCAILTDTGSFRYPRVDAEIHRVIAHLLECGADPVAIYSAVYEQWSGGRIHLLGEALAGLITETGGTLAHVSITREMLGRSGTKEEDTDNFTSYPMSVTGVQVGILFLEMPSGVKISFRSRGEIPINELAREFGGNGHKNAAGARIYDVSLPDVRDRVLAAARRYLPKQEPSPR